MKIYRITPSGVFSLLVEGDLSIGEEGRGRQRVIIPVLGVGNSFRLQRKEAHIILVRGDFPDDGRCIAVIAAAGGYSKGRNYTIPSVEGLTTIVKGWWASGIAGRASSSEEAICLASSGCSFFLRSKYAGNWFTWDGEEWLVESDPEHKARIAAQSYYEEGEGEWL